MATVAERQVWLVLIGVAFLGTGVRVMGLRRLERTLAAAHPDSAAGSGPAVGGGAALARQRAAVDSARGDRAQSRRGRPERRPPGGQTPRIDTSTHPLPGSILKVEPVDVNSATVTELERLPRVGPALARRIVAWRETHGPFKGPEDLRHIRGIGPAIARQLSDLVTFSGWRRPFSREASASTRVAPPPA